MIVIRPALTLRNASDGTLELSLPLTLRLSFFSAAALILASLILFHVYNIASLIVMTVCILGGMYREHWIFNRNAEQALYQYGLLFFMHTTRFDLNSIRYVELRDLVHSRTVTIPESAEEPDEQEPEACFFEDFTYLALITVEGERITLETRDPGRMDSLKRNGRAVAEYIAKPFIER